MKTLQIVCVLSLMCLKLYGAASSSEEKNEQTFFFLNDTENTVRLRTRIGGDTQLEFERSQIALALEKKDLSNEEKTCAQKRLDEISRELSKKPVIKVILPEDRTKVEQGEFFTLNPRTAFNFLYEPVTSGLLRIRAWPQEILPTPDIDKNGQPTETSDANRVSSLFGSAPRMAKNTRGLVLSDAIIPNGVISHELSTTLRKTLPMYFVTKSIYGLQETITNLKKLHAASKDIYTRFDAIPETYTQIPPLERYTKLD